MVFQGMPGSSQRWFEYAGSSDGRLALITLLPAAGRGGVTGARTLPYQSADLAPAWLAPIPFSTVALSGKGRKPGDR